eukprot:SAG22_NODE_6394_length_862_cov_0.920052_1_plen_198_part_10
MEDEENFVSFGDEIALEVVPDHVDDNVGFVCTIPYRSDSLYVHYMAKGKEKFGPRDQRMARFTICPPFRSAEKQRLNQALDKLHADHQRYTKEQIKEKMEKIAELRAEADRDGEDFQRYKGKPIIFGQRITLHQDFSNLTVSFSKASSTDESRTKAHDSAYDALTETRMVATSTASSGLVLRIMPGFQIRMEGDRVRA